MELIQNLFGNPMFRDEIVYAAEKHVNTQGMRLYSEMHWSEWWWNTQVYYSHSFFIPDEFCYILVLN